MAHDYDAPRSVDVLDDRESEAIDLLRTATHVDGRTAPDEGAGAESIAASVLPAGWDRSTEGLSVAVIPQQPYEFRCSRCFLVLHRTLIDGTDLCRDCAA